MLAAAEMRKVHGVVDSRMSGRRAMQLLNWGQLQPPRSYSLLMQDNTLQPRTLFVVERYS